MYELGGGSRRPADIYRKVSTQLTSHTAVVECDISQLRFVLWLHITKRGRHTYNPPPLQRLRSHLLTTALAGPGFSPLSQSSTISI